MPPAVSSVSRNPRRARARVVFDARPANAILAPWPDPLLLFTLPEFVSTVHRFPYLEIVDYRNFYYQFPVPGKLAMYFAINCGGTTYLPRALPMGFREACAIAQLASLLLRATASRESRWKAAVEWSTSDARVTDTGARAERNAGHHRDRAGGAAGQAILVLLDGILVATRDPALGAAWRARLASNGDHTIRPKMRESGHSRDRDYQAPLEFAGVCVAKEGFWPRSQLDPEAAQPRAGPERKNGVRFFVCVHSFTNQTYGFQCASW